MRLQVSAIEGKYPKDIFSRKVWIFLRIFVKNWDNLQEKLLMRLQVSANEGKYPKEIFSRKVWNIFENIC